MIVPANARRAAPTALDTREAVVRGGVRSSRRTWWDGVVAYWDKIILLDFVLGALILFNGYSLGGSGQYPFGVVLAVLIIAVGVFRRPRVVIPGGVWLIIGAAVLYAYLVLVSIKNGEVWMQRTLRFALLTGAAVMVAQRRLDVRSMIIGACASSLLNVPAYYLGLTSDYYPPYLTGIYGDKNVSGMYYAIWGILGLMAMRRRWAIPWFALCTVFLVLTGSRTSISAFLAATVWLLLRNRVGLSLRLGISAAVVWSLIVVEQRFARVGIFSDRGSTDWYRAQIDAATQLKVDLTPWTGIGLNQGYVVLGGFRRALFHDSYAQAFVEGGYFFLGATLFVFGVLGLGLFSTRRTVPPAMLASEAAVVVVMVCAWKLGETFMTTGAFFVLAVALGERFGKPVEQYPWKVPLAQLRALDRRHAP